MRALTNFNGLRAWMAFVVFAILASYSCKKEADQKPITTPVVKTVEMIDFTVTSVMAKVNIISDGGDKIIAKGVCWSTNPIPTLADNKAEITGADLSFSILLTNLIVGTKYYARSYATNSVGTSFGEIISFDKQRGPLVKAVIIIKPVIDLKINSATISAYVIPGEDGTTVSFEYSSSADGIWHSNPLPTSYGGNDTVKLLFPLADLSAKTVYNYRVRATNSAGEVVSALNTFITYSVVDIDGNLYHEVNIGNQTWLVENLKTTHYQNGDPIPLVSDMNVIGNASTGLSALCNNDPKNTETYGLMYNGFAATDSRNIAIKGWHVPTYEEWHVLQDYLGGWALMGPQMIDTHYWTGSTGTNASGFTARPNGEIDYTSSSVDYHYLSFGVKATFGSSSIFGGSQNFVNISKAMNYGFALNGYYNRKYLSGIRLIKN